MFKRILLVLSALIVITSCSVRDFSSKELQGYYDPPIITIYSPTNNSQVPGNVLLSGNVKDNSGVDRIEVNYGDNNGFTLYANENTDFDFSTNLMYFYSMTDTIKIYAYDKLDANSYVEVKVDVHSVVPYLQIINPNPYHGWIYTNTISMMVSGTCSISEGWIDSVHLIRDSDGSDTKATGTTTWSANINLLQNATNSYRVIAYSDQGLTYEEWFTVIEDSTPPIVWFDYPTNGQFVPQNFLGKIRGNDSLSYIQGYVFQMDDCMFETNYDGQKDAIGLTNGPHRIWAYARDIAGNESTLITNFFTVSALVPEVSITNPNHYYTNANNFSISGTASVSNAYTIDSIQISMDGGAYTEITRDFPSSNWTSWSYNTGALADGMHTFRVVAYASSGYENYFEQEYHIDTVAPKITVLSPANGEVFVNIDNFYYEFRFTDTNGNNNNSGLDKIIKKLSGPGVSNTTETNECYGNWDIESSGITFTMNGGAIITNTVIISDMAGNIATNISTVSVYPHIFVGKWGNVANPGVAAAPISSIQKAVDKAVGLGVSNVIIYPGIYSNGDGLNSDGTGISISNVNHLNLIGGFDFLTNQTFGLPSILEGNNVLEHLIKIYNSHSIYIRNFFMQNGLANAASAPENKGGGLYIDSSSYSNTITNCMMAYNKVYGFDSKGGGVYIGGNWNTVVVNLSWNSAEGDGGGIFVDGDSNFVEANISNNTSGAFGGGIAIDGDFNCMVGNIAYNTATNIGGGGGGVYINAGDNNIIASEIQYNTATDGGGIFTNSGFNATITGLVTNNIPNDFN